MLVIRFNRTGRRNRAQYRLVVQEKEIAPGGRHIEVVGSYDPHHKKSMFKEERIQHWIEQGAQPSDSVYNLLVAQAVIKGEKKAIKMKRPEKKEAQGDDAKDIKNDVVVEKKKDEVAQAPAKEGVKESAKKEEKKVEKK